MLRYARGRTGNKYMDNIDSKEKGRIWRPIFETTDLINLRFKEELKGKNPFKRDPPLFVRQVFEYEKRAKKSLFYDRTRDES